MRFVGRSAYLYRVYGLACCDCSILRQSGLSVSPQSVFFVLRGRALVLSAGVLSALLGSGPGWPRPNSNVLTMASAGANKSSSWPLCRGELYIYACVFLTRLAQVSMLAENKKMPAEATRL